MKDIQSASNVNIVQAPAGFEGPGFFATKLDHVVGLARKIQSGHCRLQQVVAELNLWQQWHQHTI